MSNEKGCGCAKEFDAETAYKRLNEKYNDLADLLIDHFEQPETRGRTMKSATTTSVAELIKRIVGGQRVPEGAYPECCLVGRQNTNGTLQWFCTGVLVHPRIVLTAAHCYRSTNKYVIALNTINQNALDNAEVISVKKALPHAGYAQTGKLNDICVLVLSQPAVTVPVELASKEEINAALKTTLVGFGNEDVNSTVGFGIKREVTVDIESIRRRPSDNLDAEESHYDYESDLEFVAGGNGYDSCNGDSGGPAYIIVDGVRKVAGLTSRATKGATTACGEGGIYTRVDEHLDFITGLIPS
jgi:secreted trypsin-like serine protease